MAQRVNDQADGLRRLMDSGPGRLVAVVGCGPAVGATSVCVNLAAALLQQGKDVLLLDERSDAVPTSVERQGRLVLLDAVLDGQGRLSLLAAQADHVVVVLQPHVASITASYACIKRLQDAHSLPHVRVLVNCVTGAAQAQHILANLVEAGSRHLTLTLEPAGYVRADLRLAQARWLNLGIVEAFHGSPAAVDFTQLASDLLQWPLWPPGHRDALVPANPRAHQGADQALETS